MAKIDWLVDKSKRDSRGKPVVTVTNKQTGVVKMLLNPAQKGQKYAKDLKTGVNGFTGKKLTKRQKSWRAGYLSARSDNANCFNSGKKGKSKEIVVQGF